MLLPPFSAKGIRSLIEFMKHYIYDGSFDGLLTCIYECYYGEWAEGISACEAKCQESFLYDTVWINSDSARAKKVYDAIVHKISGYDLRRVYKVFLSNDPQKEMKILRYLQKGFKVGRNISNLHGDSVVFDVQLLEHKVGLEVHRLYGLVRFQELYNRIMYSCIEPDHDVLELMAEHFVSRFSRQPFILHDKRRGKAIFSSNGNWYISDFNDSMLSLSQSENEFQALWKLYFDAIAIKERTNPRCQKNFMPTRYWKNLTEKQI